MKSSIRHQDIVANRRRLIAFAAGLFLLLVAIAIGQNASPGVSAESRVVQGQSCAEPQWSTIDAPMPAGADSAALADIAVVSPDDIWAVGNTYPGCTEQTIIEHWDGSQWRIVPSPNPGSAQLSGISAISASDIWAVGNAIVGRSRKGIVLHWNGASWSEVAVPADGSYVYLNDVLALSPNDVWAVGEVANKEVECGSQYLIGLGREELYALHYDGSRWSIVNVPPVFSGIYDPSRRPIQGASLYQIAAASPMDIWATGNFSDGIDTNRTVHGNVALHWNGSVWERMPDPPASGKLVARPDGEAWLASSTGLVRWNGSSWGTIETPDVGGLLGISMLSASDVWVLGKNALLHWDGSTWTAKAGGSPTQFSGGFSAISDQEMWLAATDRLGDGKFKPRIARYSCDVLAPAPTATATSLPTAAASPTAVPTIQIPGDSSRTFSETGKIVSGLFLDYWDKNGGLAQQGYPISLLIGEVSELDHKPYTVQYFERAVFEYHPENQPPFNVLLSQLGTFQYKKKYPQGAPNQQPNSSPESVLFSETDHRVGGKFLDYWKSHGSIAQQGYPISDEFVEKSDLNGKEYLVQYFERAVFEYHPENQPPYDVLLSQLGTFQYKAKHGGR